jgi:hypothetical protein
LFTFLGTWYFCYFLPPARPIIAIIAHARNAVNLYIRTGYNSVSTHGRILRYGVGRAIRYPACLSNADSS